MGYTRGCEPLRVWNRLEPRSRSSDFSRALRAEIHDPLWMIARQWQLGEARGEDTGSPIVATVAVRTTAVTEVLHRGGQIPRTGALPLEALIERDLAPDDLAWRARLGQRWLEILDHHGRAFTAGGGTPAYDPAAARTRTRAGFALAAPPLPAATTGADAVIARAREGANPALRQLAAATAGRAIDGAAVRAALPAGPLTWAALPAALRAGVAPAHQAFVVAALEAFRTHVDGLVTAPAVGAAPAWDASRLEYAARCRVPRPGGDALELRVDEHDGGALDWYAFDLGATIAGAGAGTAAPITTTVTVVPTLAQFPGQPHPRLWQLEDGGVDLGNIDADTTDVAKILVAEFALVYGNNWFVLPCPVEVGALCEVEGIVVTDVFGQRSLVRSATRGEPATWTRWGMFELSPAPGVPDPGLAASHLFVPPTSPAALDGARLEVARFVRDEMANRVWAIETRVPDGAGGGRDGHDAASRFADAVRALAPASTAAPAAAPLRYTLGSTVPENWIPFLPVHVPGSDREIRLQRASMPRFLQGTIRPVRPVTQLLRSGLAADDRQTDPYFLDEAEVPRAGVEISGGYQRARWIDGRTIVWYAARRSAGRGAGSSGLRFDVVSDAEPT